MPDPDPTNHPFIQKITEIVEEHLSDERFGVSELARETGMSRSNLLRRVKKDTSLSVSQFIRQVRLKRAMEMLRHHSFTVSEVAYKVGFSSVSYFIKCFGDHFGYPPGEVGNKEFSNVGPGQAEAQGSMKKRFLFIGLAIVLVVAGGILFMVLKPFSSGEGALEKSIAVLPFRNDSNDSSNVYIINGLMESILDNLQQIEDLRVISRTSVEQYRNNPKTSPEIARELNATFLVEGSGQKIGDQIMLTVQLVEGSSDDHLWSGQFTRQAKDIFALQKEVAMRIAHEIEAIITPEEAERINKIPTDDLVAYDYFLKGLDLFFSGTREGLQESIPYFEKAIARDGEFARAYADLSLAYGLLDLGQVEKKYVTLIGQNADQALLFDSKLAQGLIAKAFYFIVIEQYNLALPYLEKALEYNPNSALVINTLSDYYARLVPDTEKYLEYALKGIRLDIAAQDSTDASFIYLHISNAFMQSGFVNEAEQYIARSLDYNPENLYAAHLNAFIHYGITHDLPTTRDLLVEILNSDLTRIEVIRDIGMISYYMRDYEGAHRYYKKFIEIREAQKLDLDRSENAKIAMVWAELGLVEESEHFLRDYLDYAETDNSIYKNLSLAVYYSSTGDLERAVEQMKLFSLQENYPYWYVLFLDIDPLLDPVREVPEFKTILGEIEKRFREYHERMRASLEEKGLI